MSKTSPLPASIEVNGDEIRRRRMALGETLTSFAAKVGISYGYLSQIERGTRRMSPPAVQGARPGARRARRAGRRAVQGGVMATPIERARHQVRDWPELTEAQAAAVRSLIVPAPRACGMTRLARDYADAYATAYRFTLRYIPPARWLLNVGLMPGTPVRATLALAARRACS